jgi:hypothetical protein
VRALVLDSGAFIAVDRNDRPMMARLRVAQSAGVQLRTTAVIIAEVWRDPVGRQANIARLLKAVDIRAVDERLGRDAGVLLGRAGTRQAADATIVAIAAAGDQILTSDPGDIGRLVHAAERHIGVIDC